MDVFGECVVIIIWFISVFENGFFFIVVENDFGVVEVDFWVFGVWVDVDGELFYVIKFCWIGFNVGIWEVCFIDDFFDFYFVGYFLGGFFFSSWFFCCR